MECHYYSGYRWIVYLCDHALLHYLLQGQWRWLKTITKQLINKLLDPHFQNWKMSLLFFHQLPTFPFQISDLTQKCSAASLHIVPRWRARPRLVVTGQLLITIIRIWMCPAFLNITCLSKVTGNREQDLLHYIIHEIPKLVRGLENVTRAFSIRGSTAHGRNLNFQQTIPWTLMKT